MVTINQPPLTHEKKNPNSNENSNQKNRHLINFHVWSSYQRRYDNLFRTLSNLIADMTVKCPISYFDSGLVVNFTLTLQHKCYKKAFKVNVNTFWAV